MISIYHFKSKMAANFNAWNLKFVLNNGYCTYKANFGVNTNVSAPKEAIGNKISEL